MVSGIYIFDHYKLCTDEVCSMEVEFDVNITPGVLYDYLLSHTYRSLSGIIGAVVGALLIVAFASTLKVPYPIAGIVIIAYLPWTLFIRSRQQYLANPGYKLPLHFRMDDEGIEVSQDKSDAESARIPWSDVYKACSSSASILVYTNKVNAFMLPKKDLGDKKSAVIQAISTHLDPAKVKIRGN